MSDLLGARLAALPAGATRLLAVAAAASRAVDHRLLTAASGLAEDDAAAALRAAVQHAALVAAAAPGVYRFRHALLQEVVYERLLPGERQALHRELARALEADPDLGPPDPASAAAELADHWDRAGTGRGRWRRWSARARPPPRPTPTTRPSGTSRPRCGGGRG